MKEPAGLDGELIDRLVAAINSPREPDWEDLAWYTTFAVGGPELQGIVPEPGDEPMPGTVGAKMLETLQPVSREEYFRRIRARLTHLVRSGLREDLIVRALRDELTADLQKVANTEVGDTRREELRAEIQHAADSPEAIARFRASLSKKDPEVASLTDEQVSDRLRHLAEGDLMNPTSANEAQKRWARVARWQEDIEAVSDQMLELWRDRYLRRATKNL